MPTPRTAGTRHEPDAYPGEPAIDKAERILREQGRDLRTLTHPGLLVLLQKSAAEEIAAHEMPRIEAEVSHEPDAYPGETRGDKAERVLRKQQGLLCVPRVGGMRPIHPEVWPHYVEHVVSEIKAKEARSKFELVGEKKPRAKK